jgi:hypothetical protein
MAVGDFFKYARRVLFPKATPEQQLLKLVKPHKIGRVVELGIDSLDTTAALLAALGKLGNETPVAYTAVDRFDDRPAGEERLSLVATYRRLIATGAKVRLTPGGFATALASEANSLAGTDLLLMSRGLTDEAVGHGWFFVPRMLHPGTIVIQRVAGADADAPDWRVVPTDEVLSKAAGRPARRAA